MIKIRYKIMLWVAGAGLVSSLVFSLAVYLEMREQPLELLDAQLVSMAAGLSRQMAADPRFLDGEDSATILLASEQDWVRIYDERKRLLFQSTLAGMVDLEREQQRLSAEFKEVTQAIVRSEQLLANEDFLAKAPEQVLQRERDKLADYRQRWAKLQERLQSLQS